MGGDFCCPCFTGGETETHTCSWHHTVGWAAQSGLELKTSKRCCHMLWELERKQLKWWALNTSVWAPSGVQKPGRHLWAPAASPWSGRGSALPAQLTSKPSSNLSSTEDCAESQLGTKAFSESCWLSVCQNCLVPFWQWKPGPALSVSQELLAHRTSSWHGLHLAIPAAWWCSSGCTGGDELPHKQTFHLPSHSRSHGG